MARKVQNKQTAKKNKTHLQGKMALTDTLHLIETDLEVKSFIYQQINEFTPYVTPETNVIVLARNPEDAYADEEHAIAGDDSSEDHYPFRIAIVLKENEATIEAEGFGRDIYDAITAASKAMLHRLCEIHEEIESPQDRLNAIQQACENPQVH
ncbi:MAG: hypothetical protein V4654_09420 [Bdellovibrionota bacterium]